MAYKATILLGQIVKVHGFEGAVTVRLEHNFTGNIPDLDVVFIEIDGKRVPFFVSSSEYTGGNNLRLKFTWYESVSLVREMTGCRIFLTTGGKPSGVAKEIGDLKGYRIQQPGNKPVGIIRTVTENPGQWLLRVESENNKELLIPFHEDLIIRIDKRKKLITMDLPEGLEEIN